MHLGVDSAKEEVRTWEETIYEELQINETQVFKTCWDISTENTKRK